MLVSLSAPLVRLPAEPFQAVPAIARAAQRLGVKIIENCAVRSVEKQAGAVNGVHTELGFVRAGKVVCAGGAWSSTFLEAAGEGAAVSRRHAGAPFQAFAWIRGVAAHAGPFARLRCRRGEP